MPKKQDVLERRLSHDKGPAPLPPSSTPKVEEAGGGNENVRKRESRERTSRPVSMMPTVNGQKDEAPPPTRTRSSSASNRNRRRAAPPPLTEAAVNALAKPPKEIMTGSFFSKRLLINLG